MSMQSRFFTFRCRKPIKENQLPIYIFKGLFTKVFFQFDLQPPLTYSSAGDHLELDAVRRGSGHFNSRLYLLTQVCAVHYNCDIMRV